MSREAALKCLTKFARHVIKQAESGQVEPQNLTKKFNGNFDCIVHMNPGGLWMKAVAPFLRSKESDDLTQLILEIHQALKARQFNLPNSSTVFRVTHEENSLWRRILKEVPHVLPDGPVSETKPVKIPRSHQEQALPAYGPAGNA
ncbi:MAG: hypothetical protein DYH13_10425 [Alphaproteobacteria bacterium PRO2]|nr:hypothetical protein [Alphaproteobacteria bacterium PRO2]